MEANDKEAMLTAAREKFPLVKQWFWTGETWWPLSLAVPFGGLDKWMAKNEGNIRSFL